MLNPTCVARSHGSIGVLHARDALACLLLACLVVACSRREAPAERESDSVLTTPPSALPQWTLAPAMVRLGERAASRNEAPFLNVPTDGAWLSDGRALVVDGPADHFYLFDLEHGTFQAFGGAGRGPGEFTWIRTVTVTHGDSLVIWDAGQQMLKVFDPDAGLIRTERLPTPAGATGSAEVWPLPGGKYLHLSSRPRVEDFDLSAEAAGLGPGDVRPLPETAEFRIVRLGDVTAGPMLFPGTSSVLFQRGSAVQPLAPIPAVAVRRDRVFYASGHDDRIIELDDQLRTMRVVEWPGLREPLEPSDLAAVRERMRRDGFSESSLRIMLADEVLPDSLPSLKRLLLDRQCRLWIAAFEPRLPTASEREWYVLDSDLDEIARLVLPDDRRRVILDVDGERVLLASFDPSTDEPTIEVAKLIRATDSAPDPGAVGPAC